VLVGNPTRILYELANKPSEISAHIHCRILVYKYSAIFETMGSNGTKRNTWKPNINAEDKIDGQPIDVEIPAKDITIKHHMHLR